MATIARFVAEMGVDPAGVRAGLDRAARMIGEFTKTIDRNMNGIRPGINQARNDLGQFTKSVDGIEGAFQNPIRAADTFYQKILLIAAALGVGFAIRAGIDFNRTVESATLGIATLITAQAELRDSSGRLLDDTEALGAAQAIAADQTLQLRIAGLKTAATTEELTEAFQGAVGVGLRYGLTLDEIRKVTIGITQAAAALGLPMNQLNEEVRSLLSGNISIRNTRIATALGITNEDVRNWQQAGTLATNVLERLKAFNVAGEASARTWAGVTSNIREAFGVFMGDVTRPAFDAFKIAANAALSDVFDLDNAQISDKFSGILRVGQRIFGDLGDLLARAIGAAVNAAKDFNIWLEENRDEVDKLLDTFGLVLSTVGSIVGDLGKLLLALTATGVEAGFFRTVMVGAGLAAAEIHTAFQGLVIVFSFLGHLILSVLLEPLIFLNGLIAKIVGLVDDDLAAAFQGVADWGANFLDNIRDGIVSYVDDIADAGTATDKFLAKLQAIENQPGPSESINFLPGGDIEASRGGTKVTPRKVAEDAEDAVAALEKLAARLITLNAVGDKTTAIFQSLKGQPSQFAQNVAAAIITAEKALAAETDKFSDNAVRLAAVLDRLRDAFLGLAGAKLPDLSLTPLGRVTTPGRTTLLRGGAGSTVGLNGVRGMPGFTLPQPKAAPTPRPTQSAAEIRFNAAMAKISEGAESAGRSLLGMVRSGGLAVLENIVRQLNPFALIVGALSDAMKPLEPVLRVLGQIIADVLAPIFEELAPIIQAFIPFFRALLQIVAPLVKAMLPLLLVLVPILEALFPVIKFVAIAFTYVVEAAATVASMLLRFGGNVIIVIGEIFYALAKAIDSLPGIGAKGAMRAAEGLIDVGRGMLQAADEAKKTAQAMGKARDEIRGVEIDHTVEGIEDLGDAASKTAAALMNVPSWFKINLARFRAADPVGGDFPGDGRTPGGERRRRFPIVRGATDTGGMTAGGSSGGGGVTITGDVLIDARTMSAGELFDAILDEGQKRARAQGVGTWSEVR